MVNKNGLSRNIPSEIKRAVRQQCGFGCLICGLAIVQYEHFNPDFFEAIEHNIEKIALLCPQCHAKVTTGFWSKQKVAEARLNPFCIKEGFSSEFLFDLGKNHPSIKFGGVDLKNCSIPIEVGGKPLFKIDGPEDEGGPFRLSGYFCDSAGSITLAIDDNEWLAYNNNWDVEVSGGSIVIREAPGNIHLKLDSHPPDSIIVAKLNMSLNGIFFKATSDSLMIKFQDGSEHEFSSCLIDNCQVGLSF